MREFAVPSIDSPLAAFVGTARSVVQLEQPNHHDFRRSHGNRSVCFAAVPGRRCSMKTPAMKLLSCLSVCFLWASVAAGDIYIGPTETLQTSVDAGRIVNQGLAVGTMDEPLVFGPATRVQGGGEFVGTLSLGVFAPGNSPGVTTGENQAFGATSIIEIELGGTLPGFSANNHDQIRDAATLALLGGKLSILPYNNFIPTVGNAFVVLTWQTGLMGSFGTILIDPFFTSHGVTFTAVITNPTGSGNLTLRAVATAVPEVGAFVGVGTLALICGSTLLWRKYRRSIESKQ